MRRWRDTREYRIWRIEVIRRDKICQICGSRRRRQAHHINHATYFKELRFVVSNGVCLCSKCHSHYHNDFVGNYRKKCDRYSYDNFVQLTNYFKDKWKTNS